MLSNNGSDHELVKLQDTWIFNEQTNAIRRVQSIPWYMPCYQEILSLNRQSSKIERSYRRRYEKAIRSKQILRTDDQY